MRKLLTFLFFVAGTVLFAQNNSITEEALNHIRQSYDKNDPATRALTNALSNYDITKIALDRENLSTVDHNFKYKVEVKGITNQKKSGRCWMFTSMNVLRPMVIDKYKLSNFEFSQNYLYFWDILEKANLYLEAQIKYATKPMDDKYVDWLFKSPVGDGGVWNSFTNLAEKYGLVPKEVFPESNSSENTGWMIRLINRKLREDGLAIRKMALTKIAAQKLQQKKTRCLGRSTEFLP